MIVKPQGADWSYGTNLDYPRTLLRYWREDFDWRASLTDSPAGLAGWIVEKFRSWSDCGGDVETRFTKDELLTNITVCWATAFASFPHDLLPPPREWGERFFNIQRWTNMPRGGYFAAMEEPELLAEDIRAFFRPLRRL
jgi:microsomal epoxide hydrolase